MIISIDTNKDSKESIKQIINFLQNHLGDNNSSLNVSPITDSGKGLFGMFDNDSSQNSSSIQNNNQVEENQDIFNMFNDPNLKPKTFDNDYNESEKDRENGPSKKQDMRMKTY